MRTLRNKQDLEFGLWPLKAVFLKSVLWGHLHQYHAPEVFIKNPDTWATFLEILIQETWSGAQETALAESKVLSALLLNFLV